VAKWTYLDVYYVVVHLGRFGDRNGDLFGVSAIHFIYCKAIIAIKCEIAAYFGNITSQKLFAIPEVRNSSA
jgi:hypothetical protein